MEDRTEPSNESSIESIVLQSIGSVGGGCALGGCLGYTAAGESVSSCMLGAAIGGLSIPVLGCIGLGSLKAYDMYLNRIQRATTPMERQVEMNELFGEMRRRGESDDRINQMYSIIQSPGGEIQLGTEQSPPEQEMVSANPMITGDSYKKGGFVKRTGMAYVHKGEYVVPRHRVKKCKVCV